MARKRMIDPGIWASEDFGHLSLLAQVYCIGIISNADDEGRIKASPAYLKAIIRPYGTEDSDTVLLALREIYATSTVLPYEVDGKQYAFMPNWKKFQYIQRPTPSKLPTPPEPSDIPPIHVSPRVVEVRLEENRGESTTVARTKDAPTSPDPASSAPVSLGNNSDPVSALYRTFHQVSAREPIPAGKRSDAPAIRQDAVALIARVGLDRAQCLIEEKVQEQNRQHDPLAHVGAAIRFVMTDLNRSENGRDATRCPECNQPVSVITDEEGRHVTDCKKCGQYLVGMVTHG